MRRIELIELTLANFQGATTTFRPNGDAAVYAKNGGGKTRLMSAYLWLLTGKDSMERKDFEIKNLDADGNHESGLDHVVEAVLSIGGVPLALKKVYHEVWAKKRGNAQAEMTGNTTDHFIDGVPVKESEYKAHVASVLGDEATLKLLTNPSAFPALPWQKQRSILLEACGNVSDAQIIASDEALAPLTEMLTKYTVSKTPVDDLKKVTMARKTELNKQIDQIPVRIDETRRALPDVTGLDQKELAGIITNLEASLNDAKLRLQGIDTGGNFAQLSKNLSGVTSDIMKLEQIHYQDAMKTVSRLNQKIGDLTFKKGEIDRRANGIKNDIETKQGRIAAADTTLETLREKWTGINDEEFQDSTDDTCPACGQSLPTERVQEARDKALAEFNRSKAERLTDIEIQGKRLRAERDREEQGILDLQKLEVPASTYDEDILSLTTERDAIKAIAEDYDAIPGRAEMVERKAEIEKQIQAEKACVAVDREKVQLEEADIKKKLIEAKAQADTFPRRAQGEKRIEELKAEEKQYSKEYEALEKQLFLIEKFTRAKASMLNDRINGRFEFVRFKLFNQLVNGGIEECCVFTVNGVPYDGGLNSAARTQGGLDIVRTLQQHYGIAPVCWIDNRESCTEIPAMECQVISLYVSPEDTVLRIETDNGQMRLAL